MVDEAGGTVGGGPPSFPGGGSEGAPQSPPPMPPPPPPPPSYPAQPPGGYPPPQAGYASSPGVPGTSPYASWGLRLGGWLIDLVILVVVQAVLSALFRKSSALTVHYNMTRQGVIHHQRIDFLVVIIVLVIGLAYSTILVGGPGGKTVGMMAVGVRAVRTEGNGVVGYGKALGRSLVELILRVTGIGFILDYLWPLWDQKRQTLHDKAAGTVVIRTRIPG
jgi:uncharacterized RDD family membrane protein YckC